jgi:hypothetical protein
MKPRRGVCPICGSSTGNYYFIIDCDLCYLSTDLNEDGEFVNITWENKSYTPEQFKRLLKLKAFL